MSGELWPMLVDRNSEESLSIGLAALTPRRLSATQASGEVSPVMIVYSIGLIDISSNDSDRDVDGELENYDRPRSTNAFHSQHRH